MLTRRIHRRRPVVRVRGGVWTRTGVLLTGLFLFASGIVALLESRLGLSPWDVLHQGLAGHTRLSFGEASIAVSLALLALGWSLRARLGVGTIANAALVGTFVEALTSVDHIERLASQPLAIRLILLAAGLSLMGAGTALYLSADFGAGPRDSLMVVGAERLGVRIGIVRGVLEVSVLSAGAALGGTVGLGTVAFALGIGPAVELGVSLLARSPLALPEYRAQDGCSPGSREVPTHAALETA